MVCVFTRLAKRDREREVQLDEETKKKENQHTGERNGLVTMLSRI